MDDASGAFKGPSKSLQTNERFLIATVTPELAVATALPLLPRAVTPPRWRRSVRCGIGGTTPAVFTHSSY